MAYPYTRSRARGEVADSDIEPSDSATSPLSIFEGPSVEAVEGPQSASSFGSPEKGRMPLSYDLEFFHKCSGP